MVMVMAMATRLWVTEETSTIVAVSIVVFVVAAVMTIRNMIVEVEAVVPHTVDSVIAVKKNTIVVRMMMMMMKAVVEQRQELELVLLHVVVAVVPK